MPSSTLSGLVFRSTFQSLLTCFSSTNNEETTSQEDIIELERKCGQQLLPILHTTTSSEIDIFFQDELNTRRTNAQELFFLKAFKNSLLENGWLNVVQRNPFFFHRNLGLEEEKIWRKILLECPNDKTNVMLDEKEQQYLLNNMLFVNCRTHENISDNDQLDDTVLVLLLNVLCYDSADSSFICRWCRLLVTILQLLHHNSTNRHQHLRQIRLLLRYQLYALGISTARCVERRNQRIAENNLVPFGDDDTEVHECFDEESFKNDALSACIAWSQLVCLTVQIYTSNPFDKETAHSGFFEPIKDSQGQPEQAEAQPLPMLQPLPDLTIRARSPAEISVGSVFGLLWTHLLDDACTKAWSSNNNNAQKQKISFSATLRISKVCGCYFDALSRALSTSVADANDLPNRIYEMQQNLFNNNIKIKLVLEGTLLSRVVAVDVSRNTVKVELITCYLTVLGKAYFWCLSFMNHYQLVLNNNTNNNNRLIDIKIKQDVDEEMLRLAKTWSRSLVLLSCGSPVLAGMCRSQHSHQQQTTLEDPALYHKRCLAFFIFVQTWIRGRQFSCQKDDDEENAILFNLTVILLQFTIETPKILNEKKLCDYFKNNNNNNNNNNLREDLALGIFAPTLVTDECMIELVKACHEIIIFSANARSNRRSSESSSRSLVLRVLLPALVGCDDGVISSWITHLTQMAKNNPLHGGNRRAARHLLESQVFEKRKALLMGYRSANGKEFIFRDCILQGLAQSFLHSLNNSSNSFTETFLGQTEIIQVASNLRRFSESDEVMSSSILERAVIISRDCKSRHFSALNCILLVISRGFCGYQCEAAMDSPIAFAKTYFASLNSKLSHRVFAVLAFSETTFFNKTLLPLLVHVIPSSIFFKPPSAAQKSNDSFLDDCDPCEYALHLILFLAEGLLFICDFQKNNNSSRIAILQRMKETIGSTNLTKIVFVDMFEHLRTNLLQKINNNRDTEIEIRRLAYWCNVAWSLFRVHLKLRNEGVVHSSNLLLSPNHLRRTFQKELDDIAHKLLVEKITKNIVSEALSQNSKRTEGHHDKKISAHAAVAEYVAESRLEKDNDSRIKLCDGLFSLIMNFQHFLDDDINVNEALTVPAVCVFERISTNESCLMISSMSLGMKNVLVKSVTKLSCEKD